MEILRFRLMVEEVTVKKKNIQAPLDIAKADGPCALNIYNRHSVPSRKFTSQVDIWVARRFIYGVQLELFCRERDSFTQDRTYKMKVWSGPYERYNFCDFPILISSFDASPNQ
jgi:hypothetical protein